MQRNNNDEFSQYAVQQPDEFEQYAVQPNAYQQRSSLPAAIAKAFIRVPTDIGMGILSGIKQIPSYYEEAKTEIPGLFSTFKQHPLHEFKQVGAGLTELGHNVLNIPRGVADYLSKRLELIPEEWAQKVPYQEDISEQINQLYGKPEYPGEKLIRGTVRNIPQIIGSAKLATTLNPAQLSYKNIAKNVLNTEKNVKNKYSNLYDSVFNEAREQGLGDFKVNKPVIDMKTIEKYTPENKIEGLREFFNNPTLETAQSGKGELLALKRKLEGKSTLNKAERNQYRAISNAIEDIQTKMFSGLESEINPDILSKYEKIQKGYKKEVIPYKNKAMREFKNDEISHKDLVEALAKNKKFMHQRGKYHKAIIYRQAIQPTWGKFGGLSGASLAGLTGYNLGTKKEY